MTILIKCPACQTSLRVREEYAGKKMKCPKCQGPVPVPAGGAAQRVQPARAMEPELDEDEEAEAPAERPAGAVACPECGKRNPATARVCRFCRAPLDDEEDRPRSRYKPCPECGAYGARRVTFTWWGSFYGPSMCTHVRCPECGYAYNGKTGEPNTIFVVLGIMVQGFCLILILGLVGLIFWMLLNAFKAK